MKKVNARRLVALLLVAAVLVATLAASYFYFCGNSDALWQIVSQKCLPAQAKEHSPGACLKVNENEQYVLFKASNGPLHDLLMPTFRIAGLESSILDAPEAPAFMAIAWTERGRLAEEAGFPIDDDDLSLAINSRLGRSQNHLHIHIACLQASAKEALGRQANRITSRWSELPDPIMGANYFARRVASEALMQENPIASLNEFLRSKGSTPGNFGLGMARLADGDFVLLAKGNSLFPYDMGSTGRLQDYTCALARGTKRP